MRIETERLIIRDLERKDQEQLYKIVWQKNVVRFMRDWSENSPSPESFDGYVDWHQTQKDSKRSLANFTCIHDYLLYHVLFLLKQMNVPA